jgi:hypothetical protein
MRRWLLLSSIVICSSWVILSYAGEPATTAGAAPEGAGAQSASLNGGDEVLEGAIIHRTVEAVEKARAARGALNAPTTSNLSYHGGTADGAATIGVETMPTIYLVLWGSQWNNNDPSGEQTILTNFLNGVGGSTWLNSVTQYCQGVASGTVFCNNGAGTPAGNQASMLVEVVLDNASAAPTHPSQSQFAAEAVKVAGSVNRTTAASNASTQYVIATAHRNNSRGFGTQYCAYHSSTTSSYGNIAYTNLPYITDAGANCGANFNGLGADAGITIVEGHEAGETITDQFPSTGWLASGGAENGDKCAWITSGQGAAANVTFTIGTFPVQSLWSNAFNNDTGGCVLSYP